MEAYMKLLPLISRKQFKGQTPPNGRHSKLKFGTFTQPLLYLIFMSFFALSPAYSAGSSSSDDKPSKPAHSKEYYKAVKLIKAENFDDALVILQTIVQKKPNDADIHNYIGFSLRKLGMLEKSAYHYEKALGINPRHVGALEYQGELFLALGELEKARENLDKIDKICWTQCTELKQLTKAIEAVVN